MKTLSRTITVQGVQMDVTFNYSRKIPAVINAPAERCHPEEGGIEEILEVCVNDEDIYHLLSQNVEDEIFEAIEEALQWEE